MYILTNDGNTFAIIKNEFSHQVLRAIQDEFSFDEVKAEAFTFPNTFESLTVSYTGIDNGEEVEGEVVIQQLADY